jgi:thiosulfate dehydrogenase (quinone) large subunit
VPARALLPLRVFFGLTFVYAGFDKLLDPAFFDASSPASIYGQLAAFVQVSPLAPLVRVMEPFALPLGLLIALGEIAIGLGALTGLAFRAAAASGAVLSLLFWLTASWTTTPYYYGPDLPYAFGWIALVLAGDGGLLVARSVRELGAYVTDDWPGSVRSGVAYRVRGRRAAEVEASPVRRMMIQAGALGALAFVAASFAVPLRILRPASTGGLEGRGPDASGGPGTGSGAGAGSGGGAPGGSGDGTGGTGQTDGPTGTGGGGAGSTPGAAPNGKLTLASIGTVDQHGAARARIPLDAPAPYPAGDPAIIVRLSDGSYVAYDASCTHQGCPVGWDARDNVLLCPCHGAAFDPANHGAVLGGPTRRPLLELPLAIDKQAGTISLRA